MHTSLEVTFRNVESSDTLIDNLHKYMHKLERRSGKIVSCHVTIDQPHQSHKKGKLYNVSIDMSVPRHEISASNSCKKSAHQDVYVAMRDAFRAVQSQLDTYMKRKLAKRTISAKMLQSIGQDINNENENELVSQ